MASRNLTGPTHAATTRVHARVPARLDASPAEVDALLLAARSHQATPPQRQLANIGGATVALEAGDEHTLAFWQANWEPARPGSSADASIHVVEIPGLPSQGVYCPARNQGILVNTDYYGQCKSWALGAAGVVLRRRAGVHSVHGACVEIDGQGVILVGSTGAGKSTQVAQLCRAHGARLLGDDWTFVHGFGGGKLVASQPERMLYIRTDIAARDSTLRDRLRGALLENIVTAPGRCTSAPCQAGNCMIAQGGDYCLWGHPAARALVPRAWLGGSAGVVDSTIVGRLVVLYRDAADARTITRDPGGVMTFLKAGGPAASSSAGPAAPPYFNPYLLAPDPAAEDAAFVEEMRGGALMVNTAHVGVEATAQAIARSRP